MKIKAIYSILLAATMLTSCNMDLAPKGQLDDENALESVNDVYRFRQGLYSSFRGFTSSQFFTYADIQTDMFNGIVQNGNRMGTIANGVVEASDGDITGYWASCYGAIANINYFLQYSQPVLENVQTNGDTVGEIRMKLYIGEAHFFRGFYYAMLFDRWCTVYSADKGDQEGLGVAIVTEYNPTADRSKYPGRSSMNASLKFIKDELNMALAALQEYEEIDNQYCAPNAPYLSSYAVKALLARIALWVSDYQTALQLSQEVIGSGLYQLAKVTEYAKMWTDDTGAEIIMMPYESSNETSNAIGSTWLSIYSNQAEYIPTADCVTMYESAGKNPLSGYLDARYNAYVGERVLDVGTYGSVTTQVFNKFPGNPSLQSGGPNLMNKPKPFRLSELYLIAAEAAKELNDEGTSRQYMLTFLSNRIRNFEKVQDQYENLSGRDLTNLIRQQRTMELIGEGFRLNDLRRWKQGFDRASQTPYSGEYADVNGILTTAGLTVSYSDDDHRYTWPIPSDELQSNPQMAGQQNPGYK